jgi:tetratricopeptide (TPR) repeat protein
MIPSVPATAAAEDRRRLRRQRLLLLWSAVPVLVLLGVAAKFLSLGLLAGQAVDAYAAKDPAAVEAAAEALNLANVVERHKAPFAAGDAKVLAGDYPAARILFEEALDGVPAVSPDDCVIRVNLSLAIEYIGDAKLRAEDPASAAAMYAEALDVAVAAPQGCFSGASAQDAGKQLTEAERRLDEKLAAAAQPAEAPGESQPEDNSEEQPSPQQNQLEQLEESARQAERERNAARERGDYLRDTGGAAGPDRPW